MWLVSCENHDLNRREIRQKLMHDERKKIRNFVHNTVRGHHKLRCKDFEEFTTTLTKLVAIVILLNFEENILKKGAFFSLASGVIGES